LVPEVKAVADAANRSPTDTDSEEGDSSPPASPPMFQQRESILS